MKVFKSRLFTFLLGFILATSISVVALNLTAGTTAFEPDDDTWDVLTVEEALNDLYRAKEASTILKLSETPVVSNEVHTYNVSNITGYQNFTTDNFIYGFVGFEWVGGSTTESANISYDSETGIVTFPKKIGGGTNATLDISYYPILVH